MEYSVGSLADLISGSNTPDKPKVIAKKIKKEIYDAENTDAVSIQENSTKKVKKEKKVKLTNIKVKKEKKNKSTKRKLTTDDEHKEDNDSSEIPKKRFRLNKSGAELRIENKVKEEKQEHDPEEEKHTVFVGNVPITAKRKQLTKFFSKYGEVQAVWLRGITPKDPRVPKKVAAMKKDFHPLRKSLFAYIKFATPEQAVKATAANGEIFNDHHLRVTLSNDKSGHDESRTIFIGNLSFSAEEEDLWKLFEPCGPISSVRIVRNSKTGMGIGIAYIKFQDSDGVQLAMQMEDVQLNKRPLRISLCNQNQAKKNKYRNQQKPIKKLGRPSITKKNGTGDIADNADTEQKPKHVIGKFQGMKIAEKKKKNKLDKGQLRKKQLAKKIAPKSLN